ncbi:homocysteine S-methyltransferase [Glaciihabitans sp. INWT7]|uniref:homocysteine S-methyltransferase n=1 Tax=Glaciihabitans sp. INWT7 TaxID=2596912 RepID=UPI0016294234|nr:homocysteine S-methyltransferase [Glaciihabitans sp. INWT7]QNE48013.1 homocysteine S-methyltransferase [Glaciihabitans sp. INWT7]
MSIRPAAPGSIGAALRLGGVLLDGGLGTQLETRGHDLSSSLWSARLLLENPGAVLDAHREYFRAGADVAISASYQVSHDALASTGRDAGAVDDLLRLSVSLASQARDEIRPDGWVAASVGPFGASRADGSEYRGDYGLTVGELRQWHRRRLQVLIDTRADVLAVETIPSLAEVEAIVSEIDGTGMPAWISVTSAAGLLRSGESLERAFEIASDIEEVIAVGVNCTHPRDVAAAIVAARRMTSVPVIVYPNSGEDWDAVGRRWTGEPGLSGSLVQEWIALGAGAVGGCCRIGPAQIASLAAATAS